MGEGKVGGINWAQAALVSGAVAFQVGAAALPTKTDLNMVEDRPEIGLLHATSDMIAESAEAHRAGEEMIDGAEPVAEPESAEHSDPPESSTFSASGSSRYTTATDLPEAEAVEQAEMAEAQAEIAEAQAETASDLAEASEATDQMAADMDMSGDMNDGGPGYS